MARTLILALALLLTSSAVNADPVSIATTIAFFLQGTAYAWVGYTLVAAAIAYGAADASKKRRKMRAAARAQYNAKLEDRSVTTLTAAPDWRIIYGRPGPVGGAVVAILTSDKTDYDESGNSYTKPDALKHLVIEFAHHECQAINEVYIEGQPVGALDGNGYPTGGEFGTARTQSRIVQVPPAGSVSVPQTVTSIVSETVYRGVGIDGYSVDVAGTVTLSGGNLTLNNATSEAITVNYTVNNALRAVRIQKHLGSSTQTVDAYLNSVFPVEWDTSHRLRGATYIVLTLDLEDQRFLGGPPNVTADISGRLVYDPRTTTTYFSSNVALCALDFLRSEWGYRVEDVDIDFNTVIAAANACDVAIDLTVGGVTTSAQPKYTLDGSFLTSEGRELILDEMADAMAGGVTNSGLWTMWAGAWTAPVDDLTGADLAGMISIVRSDTDYEELFNSVRGMMIPAGKSTPVEFDPYSNTTFVIADGAELWENKNLPFTNNRARARNLCRIFVEQNRAGQVINFPAKLRAWPIQIGDRVTVTSAEYGFAAKTFRVLDWHFTINSAVLLTLKEDAASIYDLADAATADPTPNTGLPNPWSVTALTGLTVTSSMVLQNDGTFSSRLNVAWTRSADNYVQASGGRIVVGWRLANALSWERVEVPGTDTAAAIAGVPEGVIIIVEIYAVNSFRQRSSSTYAKHTMAAILVNDMPFPVVLHGVAGAISAYRGNIVKVGASTAWDAGAYSSQPIVGSSVLSFTVPQTNKNVVVGLNSDPATDADYTGIDYAAAFDASGNVLIYESGTSYSAGTYTAGARCRIVYDEISVKYYINGTLVRQVAAPPSLSLSMDSAFYQQAARIEDLTFISISASARGNLVDTSTWINGLTGTVGVRGGSLFSRSGEVSENSIVLGAAPDGSLRELWQATSVDAAAGAGEADGGFVTGSVPIDNRRQYRLVLFFKNTAFSGAPGGFYLGCDGLGSTVVKTIAGVDNSNPYFISGITRTVFPQDRWHMAVGFIMPHTYGTTALGLSGVYDLATGQKVYTGVDYKWHPSAAAAAHRGFIYYCDSGNTTQLWGPRFEMCDGTEPSIDALIAMAKQSNVNVSAVDFASALGLNGQFTKWLAGQAAPDGWQAWGDDTKLAKETTITRTGPNAVRVTPASADAGVVFVSPLFSNPLEGYVRISVDLNIITNTSGGKPGVYVRLWVGTTSTGEQQFFLQPPSMVTGEWQTLTANCAVLPGQKIHRIFIYLMGSWGSFAGGHWTGSAVFDSLLADLVSPAGTNELGAGAATQVLTTNEAAGTFPASSSSFGSRLLFDGISFTPAVDAVAEVTVKVDAYTSGDTGSDWDETRALVGVGLFAVSDLTDLGSSQWRPASGTVWTNGIKDAQGASTTRASYTLTARYNVTAGVAYRAGCTISGDNGNFPLVYTMNVSAAPTTNVTLIKR